MRQEQHGNTIEMDIHGMTTGEAKRALEQLISRAPGEVKEIVVIHGYRGGQALRDMVRVRLKHPRLSGKLITLNQGSTRLLLK